MLYYYIVSLTSFINKPDPSGDLTIFMISFISSFAVTPNPAIILCIPVFDVSVSIDPNGMKTLLANGVQGRS